MRAFILTVIVAAGAGFATLKLGDKLPLAGSFADASEAQFSWPPQLNQPYPDLQLVNQDGELTRLSDYRGKVILVEPIGMSCPGCQAFCGAHDHGSFGGVTPQPGLPSIDKLVRRYGNVDLLSDQIVHVHLLLYNLRMKAPSTAEASAWAKHFGMQKEQNQLVLVGQSSMIGRDAYNMIPGFQLIDRDFVLQADSTGHSPRHDLFRELLPQLGTLAKH